MHIADNFVAAVTEVGRAVGTEVVVAGKAVATGRAVVAGKAVATDRAVVAGKAVSTGRTAAAGKRAEIEVDKAAEAAGVGKVVDKAAEAAAVDNRIAVVVGKVDSAVGRIVSLDTPRLEHLHCPGARQRRYSNKATEYCPQNRSQHLQEPVVIEDESRREQFECW